MIKVTTEAVFKWELSKSMGNKPKQSAWVVLEERENGNLLQSLVLTEEGRSGSTVTRGKDHSVTKEKEHTIAMVQFTQKKTGSCVDRRYYPPGRKRKGMKKKKT